MKASEIVQQATNSLADGVRQNYVCVDIFLYDQIRSHIADLKDCMENHGILRLENKKQYNNLNKSINTGFARIRKQMGEYAYNYSPVILERFEDEFGDKLKILYYTIKREHDRLKHPESDVVAHLSMIYLLSKYEMKRTTWYAGEVQKHSNVPMNAIYDQCIVSIRNISMQLLEKIVDSNEVNPHHIQLAFTSFEKELNECKIEFCHKES